LRRGQDRGHLSDRTFRIVSRPQRGEQPADRGLREDTPMNNGATGGFPEKSLRPPEKFPARQGICCKSPALGRHASQLSAK
jgi:hypothetical protein